MSKLDKKIIILVDLIKNINIVNVTLILAIVLSFLNINRYITFALIMLIAIMLNEITQKIRVKYLGDSKSIFENKIFVFFIV